MNGLVMIVATDGCNMDRIGFPKTGKPDPKCTGKIGTNVMFVIANSLPDMAKDRPPELWNGK